VVHYKIPVEISGSTINDRDVTITIAIDPDTLRLYNEAMYFRRTDLYYRQLGQEHYSFPNGMSVTVPAGKNVGLIDVDFRINNLDLVEKYILPLTISETSQYMPSPKKHYKKSLMRIIPFNEFSGQYSANAGMIRGQVGNSDPTPSTSMATREMRVVNHNTVFFYAGLTVEDARDRALYKVRATFVPSATTADSGFVTLAADSAKINFQYTPAKCTYVIEKEMDPNQPYLQIRTITMNLHYQYEDVTNPGYVVTYKFGGTRATDPGSYTLERRRNTQIPEEDQQEIFE
jgi:hypothetical protein